MQKWILVALSSLTTNNNWLGVIQCVSQSNWKIYFGSGIHLIIKPSKCFKYILQFGPLKVVCFNYKKVKLLAVLFRVCIISSQPSTSMRKLK